jgi:hypothetical protein
MSTKLYRKCVEFQKMNLSAPPERLVLQWGKSLGLSRNESLDVSNGLSLRHVAGKKQFFKINL